MSQTDLRVKTTPLLGTEVVGGAVCASWREWFERNQPRPRSYQGLVDAATRRCDYVVLPSADYRHLEPFLDGEMADHFGVSLRFREEQPLMMYRYPVGVGFVPHHDLVTEVELERARRNNQPVIGGDFTIVVFVNDPDDYDGGELYFPDFGSSFMPPSGSAVAFPATEDFIHGVREITRGERFTVVARPYAR